MIKVLLCIVGAFIVFNLLAMIVAMPPKLRIPAVERWLNSALRSSAQANLVAAGEQE